MKWPLPLDIIIAFISLLSTYYTPCPVLRTWWILPHWMVTKSSKVGSQVKKIPYWRPHNPYTEMEWRFKPREAPEPDMPSTPCIPSQAFAALGTSFQCWSLGCALLLLSRVHVWVSPPSWHVILRSPEGCVLSCWAPRTHPSRDSCLE